METRQQLREQIQLLEEQLKFQREHTDALDRNWDALNTINLNAIRRSLLMNEDAAIPEMVERITFLVQANRDKINNALGWLENNAMSDEEIEELL